jgi:hypothetical protein
MNWINKLTPINYLEEKARFLDDPTYDPQFVYSEPIDPKELNTYGQTKQSYCDLAQEILDQTYLNRNEADLLMMEGKVLDQEEVTERITRFLEMHELQERFEVIWSSSFVSRASIDSSTIKLRTSSEFREEGLIGLIYHEVGTHALRRINYEQQPWYKHKKQAGLTHQYLPTEEGLATLHTIVGHSFLSAYTTAIRYQAVAYAQNHSLREVWNSIGKYIQDPETRWMVAFRQKRGISDTRQPGGHTKDLVYFEGAINVWKWLVNNNFDLPSLYLGKISYKDAHLAHQLSPDFEPQLPSFYTLNPQEYQEKIYKIGTVNNFDKIK